MDIEKLNDLPEQIVKTLKGRFPKISGKTKILSGLKEEITIPVSAESRDIVGRKKIEEMTIKELMQIVNEPQFDIKEKKYNPIIELGDDPILGFNYCEERDALLIWERNLFEN